MSGDFLDEYRRRCWALVPIPAGQKGPRIKGWQTHEFSPADFTAGGNVGLILGPRSGETVDIDIDCPEALALADIYLPPTGAEFGRLSKPGSHRLYIAAGAAYEAFADPVTGATILELRAQGRDGGGHQTVIPPSVHPSGEAIEWHGNKIAPAVFDAAKLRRRCAYLAVACLVARYVSQHAAELPGPDLPDLLREADPNLGRVAFRWLALPDPDSPRLQPKRAKLSREEINLADLVGAVPNDCDWHAWNRIGMAIFAASGGSDQGGIVFDDWSAKSSKYNPYTTAARWRHYHRSPPSRIGAGTLVYLAGAAGWRPTRVA